MRRFWARLRRANPVVDSVFAALVMVAGLVSLTTARRAAKLDILAAIASH